MCMCYVCMFSPGALACSDGAWLSGRSNETFVPGLPHARYEFRLQVCWNAHRYGANATDSGYDFDHLRSVTPLARYRAGIIITAATVRHVPSEQESRAFGSRRKMLYVAREYTLLASGSTRRGIRQRKIC